MIFSSVEFFAFLAVLLFVLVAQRSGESRRRVLLVASYCFYGWWDWRFVFLILVSTIVDFFVGQKIGAATDPQRRRRWLVVSLVANLGALAYFKYANFLLDSMRPLTDIIGLPEATLSVVLPVGISFYTFQTMSYSIDVYRGRIEVEHSFSRFALFVAFFPQLVAGPIVRAREFLPQLAHDVRLRKDQLLEGLAIFAGGFVKKVLFADTLALFADPVFASPSSYDSATCWLATLAYAAQIYYDFSGYSDMAIGVGRMLGYTLPVNFRHPYLSCSVTEFWRRWHISLSTWLRDYLYISLGGNRRGSLLTYRNLMITMLLGGLWHGAAWTFVVWGALHGVALAVHKALGQLRATAAGRAWLPPMPAPLAWVATNLYVLLAWVFFRSSDFGTARRMLGQMIDPTAGGIRWLHTPTLWVLAAAALLHLTVHLRDERELRLDLSRPAAWVLLGGGMLWVLLFAPLGSSPFIYFQF